MQRVHGPTGPCPSPVVQGAAGGEELDVCIVVCSIGRTLWCMRSSDEDLSNTADRSFLAQELAVRQKKWSAAGRWGGLGRSVAIHQHLSQQPTLDNEKLIR